MPWRGPQYEGEIPTLGYRVAEWIENHVVIPDGYRRGQQYKLTDEQYLFLLHYYRLYPYAAPWPAPDALIYTGGQFRRAQKHGKDPLAAAIILAEALGPTRFDGWDETGEPVGAPYPTPLIVCLGTSEEQPLALDTPVPTPDGWTTMGDLRRGDRIFAADGSTAYVVHETPVLLGERCYAVTFSDGERITASAAHSWTVEDVTHRDDRNRTRTRTVTLTTEQLAATYRVPSDKGFRARYRVPAGVVWDLPDGDDLPVDPYILGLWLGDGSASDASITFDLRLKAEVEAIIAPLTLPFEDIAWGQGVGNTGLLRIRRRQGLCPWGHEYGIDMVGQACGPCRRTKDRTGGPDRPAPERLRTLRERLRDLDVLGSKHIPAAYLRAGHKQRLALLQGLMDSDGHIEVNGRAGFTNINRAIIDGLGELLTSLGYRWNMRFDRTAAAWRIFFVPREEPVFQLTHKASRQSTRPQRRLGDYRQIVSVESVESVPVKCVGINTTDHLFLAGRRAVPTHNTSNTWRPLLDMIRLGPLINVDGMDCGQTRINLPAGGTIEPVTTSAKARLGAPLSFVTITEALALDTPVPTPTGWTTMGDISVGDRIFGRDGSIVCVIGATEVQNDRTCYRLTFADGTSIVASDGHLWETRVNGSAALPKVRTTGEMVADGREFRVPVAADRHDWLTVDSIEPVDSVPVRCITVDAVDSLFLAGEGWIPTHNSHLFTLQGGYRRVCGAVKRNVAGMDGRWLELTNAWDPTEGSEAQVTADSDDSVRVPRDGADPALSKNTGTKRVLLDTVDSHRVDDLTDDDELYAELLRQYGDSAREQGGWVNIKGRIMHEVRSSRHLEADRRRFFLNEIVVGESVFVDPIRWDLAAYDDLLAPKTPIAIGFDGSKLRDATSLIASRMSDGRLFNLKTWERPKDADEDWKVPSVEVDQTVREVFGAYQVTLMFADPYRWQDYLDVWSALWPKQIIEFPTNVEQRFDKAIERFNTSFAAGDISHANSEILTRHCKNAVLVKGSRKKPRPGDENSIATHYLKLAKRGDGLRIDAAVAAVLAHEARGTATEKGLPEAPPQQFFGSWR